MDILQILSVTQCALVMTCKPLVLWLLSPSRAGWITTNGVKSRKGRLGIDSEAANCTHSKLLQNDLHMKTVTEHFRSARMAVQMG